MADFTITQLLLLQFILIFFNAVFACAEIAVISINENKLKKLSEGGNKQAKRLLSLTEQPAKFLATIQVGITLAGFLGSAFAADNFSDRIVGWMISLGVTMSPTQLDVIAVVGITVVLSYVTLILGELVPKRIAMQNAQKIGLSMSGLIFVIAKVFAPIVWFLTASTNGVLRLLRINPNLNADAVSEEEIRIMVDAGNQSGTIDDAEQKMIHNIFELDDKSAQKVMTHRLDVVFLNLKDDIKEWEKTMMKNRFSVYPICNKNNDDIIGTLSIKDFFKFKNGDKKSILQNAVMPPHFIKDTLHIDDLLKAMQKKRNHFAFVIDEYGGMKGVITMNDLLEEIVGELEDDNRLPKQAPLIKKVAKKTWSIKGTARIEDVSRHLDIALGNNRCDTFAGFLLEIMGKLPTDKDNLTLTYQNLQIEIIQLKNRTIEEARVTRM